MNEWMEPYREAAREKTALTINHATIVLWGLTVTELVVGLVSFLIVIQFSESILAIPGGIVVACAFSWAAREFRSRFPPHFLQHLAFAFGQKTIPGWPALFRGRRYRVFGP